MFSRWIYLDLYVVKGLFGNYVDFNINWHSGFKFGQFSCYVVFEYIKLSYQLSLTLWWYDIYMYIQVYTGIYSYIYRYI